MPLSRQQRFPRSCASVGAARAFAVSTATGWGVTEVTAAAWRDANTIANEPLPSRLMKALR